jgi:SAM-dependent methyltransferase
MIEQSRHFLSRLMGTFGEKRDWRSRLMAGQPGSVWCLDFLRLEGDRLILDGWALAPRGARPVFTVNGVRMHTVLGHPRPDLRQAMPFDERAPAAGFHAECGGVSAIMKGSESLDIRFCDEATLHPFNPGHTFYWPLAPPLHPFPDPARRKRVHGDANADGFVINGYSTFRKLDCVLGEHGRRWADCSRIIDWGCGCGRVFRYLPREAQARLVGVDIDGDNIEWCRRSFPEAEFHAVALSPPMPLPSSAFDLVLGVSVFTHLREEAQHSWLKELSRICRSGGLLLVTIHGPAAGARASLSEQQYRLWAGSGFIATGLNVDLSGAIADDAYYVDSLHTHDYVRRVWGRYFKILDIRGSYIANHQDLVVMRKR